MEPTSSRPYRDFTLPVMLIVLGVLFLLDELAPSYSISRTWPVILVVLGVLLLVRSFRPVPPPRGPRI
jgi:hypothetical protein